MNNTISESLNNLTLSTATGLHDLPRDVLIDIMHRDLTSSVSVSRNWTQLIDNSIEYAEIVLGGYRTNEPATLTQECVQRIKEAPSIEVVESVNLKNGIRPIMVKDFPFIGHLSSRPLNLSVQSTEQKRHVTFHVTCTTRFTPVYEVANTAVFNLPNLRGLRISTPEVQDFSVLEILESLPTKFLGSSFPDLTNVFVSIPFWNVAELVHLTTGLFLLMLNHKQTLTAFALELAGLSWNQKKEQEQLPVPDFLCDFSLLAQLRLKSLSISLAHWPHPNRNCVKLVKEWVSIIDTQVHGQLEECAFEGRVPGAENGFPFHILETNWDTLTHIQFEFSLALDPLTNTPRPFDCSVLSYLHRLTKLQLTQQNGSAGGELVSTAQIPNSVELIWILDFNVRTAEVDHIVSKPRLKNLTLFGIGGEHVYFGLAFLTFLRIYEEHKLESVHLQNYAMEQHYSGPVTLSEGQADKFEFLKGYFQIWLDLNEDKDMYSMRTY